MTKSPTGASIREQFSQRPPRPRRPLRPRRLTSLGANVRSPFNGTAIFPFLRRPTFHARLPPIRVLSPTARSGGSKYVIRELLSVYHVAVCKECKLADAAGAGLFATLSKSAAKERYLLTDGDLASLAFVVKEAKIQSFTRRIHLVLQRDAIAAARARHGADFDFETEREARAVAKLNRSIDAGKKKRGAGVGGGSGGDGDGAGKKARKSAARPPPVVHKAHVHSYDEAAATFDAETEKTSNTCLKCGYVDVYEVL
jgi:hypothetical protein